MIRAGENVRAGLVRAASRILLHDTAGASRRGQQLADNVDRLAGALVAHGCAGKRIGLWYQNSCAAVESFLAVEWIAGTRVPVDPGAPAAEAKAIFLAAGVDAVLTESSRAGELQGRVFVHEEANPLRGDLRPPAVDVDDEHCCLLYPRAVTDGQLFAIPVSYANWRATMELNIALYQTGRYGPWLGQDECFLSAQNIMHGTGFVGTFPFLEMGLPQVLLGSFDATSALAAMQQFQVTATVLVGPMLSRLTHAALGKPEAAASLRHVMYGGGVVSAGEIRRSMQTLGPVLVQGYGRIEGGWPLTILDLEDHQQIAAGNDELALSCGRPIECVSLKLRSISGSTPGVGELCVSSGMTVKEYSTPDGWCSLGDLARVDESGRVFYQGRLDRMINTGYHIYPDEVEEAIRRVPGIRDVRVVGESKGSVENMVAYLVAVNGTPHSELANNVRNELAIRLARYKIPSQFRFVESLAEN